MPQNRKKRSATGPSPGKHPGKTMLLPTPAATVRELALRNHIALAAFRDGKGNGHLLSDLIRVLYLVWYLQQAGFGAAKRERYLEAERILDVAAKNADSNTWFIEAVDCVAITGFLDLYERQLSSAPVYVVREAHARVRHFAQSDKHSPW